MNNQFKILWFEDDADWYKTASRRIKTSIEEHFLLFEEEEPRETGANIDFEELKSTKYDLILMDYKLASSSPTGDEIIQSIRNNQILTDILFYSVDYDDMVESFRQRIPAVDGVYLAKRDVELFSDKVSLLISKIVQRSEDIVNLRGMVLEATSSFEMKVKDFLDNLWEKLNPTEQENLNKLLKDKILDHRLHDSEDKIKALGEKKFNVPKANKSGYFMNEKLALIDAFSEEYRNNVISTSIGNGIREYYMEKLGRYRNKLGHVKVGEEIKIGENEKETINQKFHQKMRKNITELDQKFEETLNLLLKPAK